MGQRRRFQSVERQSSTHLLSEIKAAAKEEKNNGYKAKLDMHTLGDMAGAVSTTPAIHFIPYKDRQRYGPRPKVNSFVPIGHQDCNDVNVTTITLVFCPF
jgi:hypothetical protein